MYKLLIITVRDSNLHTVTVDYDSEKNAEEAYDAITSENEHRAYQVFARRLYKLSRDW